MVPFPFKELHYFEHRTNYYVTISKIIFIFFCVPFYQNPILCDSYKAQSHLKMESLKQFYVLK